MPSKPEGPGPNPQSCDSAYSQSREWDHQGCLDHFQEGQEGHFQVLEAQEGLGCLPNFSIVDFPLVEPCRILGLTTFNSSSSICQQVGF